MNKIEDLLKQMGASKELVVEFVTMLKQRDKKVHAKAKSLFEGRYNTKISEAKKICVEEVEKEKSRLARKIQVYMESKQRDIDIAAQRQRAIEEGESTQTLRQVKNLLEGNDPNAVSGKSRDLQESQQTNARLKKALDQLAEERKEAIRSQSRIQKIAEDLIGKTQKTEQYLRARSLLGERDAFLEGKGAFADGKKPWDKDDDGDDDSSDSSDSSDGKCKKCDCDPCTCSKDKDCNEGKKKSKRRVVKESRSRRSRRRIDQSRRAPVKAKSTRSAPITESKSKKSGNGDNDIMTIAGNM